MDELLLGRQTPFPTAYDPSLLQTVPFAGTGDQLVSLGFAEFTSLCPVTGQPDFGAITVSYLPSDKLIESKAFKLYLGSFRNHAVFHEGVVQAVFDRCQELLGDVPLCVHGDFVPRGGVKIVTSRSHLLQRLRDLGFPG